MFAESIAKEAIKSLDKNLWNTLHVKNTLRQLPTFASAQANEQLQANFAPFDNSKNILSHGQLNQQVKPMKIKNDKWKKQIVKLIKSQYSPKSSIKNASKMSLSASLRKSKLTSLNKVRFSMKQMYSKLDNASSINSESVQIISDKFINCQQQQEYDPQIDEIRNQLVGKHEQNKKEHQSKIKKEMMKNDNLQKQQALLEKIKDFTFNYDGKFIPVNNSNKKFFRVDPIRYQNSVQSNRKAFRSKTQPSIIPNQRINVRVQRLKMEHQNNINAISEATTNSASNNFLKSLKQDMLQEGVTIKCMGKVQTKPRIRSIKAYTQCTLSQFRALQTTQKNTVFVKSKGKTINTKLTSTETHHITPYNDTVGKINKMSISLVMGKNGKNSNNSLFLKKNRSLHHSQLKESVEIKQNIQENSENPSVQVSQIKTINQSQQVSLKTENSQVNQIRVKKSKLGRITVNSHKFFEDLIQS